MLMVKHVMPMMVEAGGGSICNTSPGSSLSGYLFLSAYASSKSAINTLTKYVATQSGKINIRCNVVSPGLILTQTARDNAAPGQFDTYESHSQIGRAHVRTPVTNAHLVCRPLLEKKKHNDKATYTTYHALTAITTP